MTRKDGKLSRADENSVLLRDQNKGGESSTLAGRSLSVTDA